MSFPQRFTKHTLAAALLGLVTVTASSALAATTIKLAHPNVPEHPMGKGFEKFKELVESRSDGEIQVDVYDSSKFGDFDSVVQGLQTGLLQMGSASIPNLAPFSDDFLIFDMPFLFPSYEAAHRVTNGPIGQKAAKALTDTGIIGLGYIDIGFRHIFNNKRSVTSLDDAKGLKIRSTPSKAHIATLNALGMNPTPIAWSEVYTSLQQKTVDGIDIDLNLAWFNKFYEVNNHLTLVGSLYSPHLVMISQIFYESLTAEQQELITQAFEEMQTYERNLIIENEEMIIKKLEEKGMTVTELSEEERARWAEATQPVYDQFEEKIGADLIERVRATIAETEK